MAILIFHSRLWPETTPLPADWLAELPPEKRYELLRSRPVRRWESMVGLRLLSHGMATLGYADFKLSEVRSGRGLKPVSGRGVDFSISHSHGLAACALNSTSGEPVGLDIEQIRPLDVHSLARYVNPEGQPPMRTVAETLERWTCIESVMKAASGAGLARIKEVQCDPDDDAIAHFDGRRWHTRQIDLDLDYAACVATRAESTGPSSAPVINITDVTWDELRLPTYRASGIAR